MARGNEMSNYRLRILNDYLEDMALVRGQGQVKFSKTKVCTCCGEAGYVPEHHRFLCVFCYCAHQNYDPHDAEAHDQYQWKRGDMPRLSIPRIGESEEPDTYYTKEFSTIEFTQEELEMILAS